MTMSSEDSVTLSAPSDKKLISEKSQNSNFKTNLNIKQSLAFLEDNKKFDIFLNFLITFILIHEILISLFTGFSVKSVLILIFLTLLAPRIKIELDEELIAIFSGLFLGIRAVGLTLSEGWFSPFSSDIQDPLISNWIMFLSAPVLGILLFFLLRYSIELFNHVSEHENKA